MVFILLLPFLFFGFYAHYTNAILQFVFFFFYIFVNYSNSGRFDRLFLFLRAKK